MVLFIIENELFLNFFSKIRCKTQFIIFRISPSSTKFGCFLSGGVDF